MQRRLILAIICVLVISVVCLIIPKEKTADSIPSLADTLNEKQIIIIDAGHGGFDGGAVASDGTLEKDLNLAVAKELNNIALCLGYKTVMVRSTDKSTDSDGEQSGTKKVKDIKNRLELMKKYDNCIFVSIHMNKYSTSQPHGAQVFYAPYDGSDALAGYIQTSVADMVQQDNKRVTKPAGKDIYLLHNAAAPAVIVECGFLSNKTDLENLKNDIYRKGLAFSVFCGIINYYSDIESNAV